MAPQTGEHTCPHCGRRHDAEPESLLHLPPGTVLEDKYLIGRVLGQGGFGITYLAYDLNLRFKLAIKEFFPQGLVSRITGTSQVTVYSGDLQEQFNYGVEKFIGEAQTLARFAKHPNIVTVRDFFEVNGTAYMVMTYIEGLTLEEYLKENGGSIPFQTTLDVMMPVMDALREVHAAGFLHRDISPDNIFIDVNGRIILIDFGAARQDLGEKSKSLSVVIKAGYAPEEQYRSRGKQGAWTDVYAVAATMYRAITGIAPPESLDRIEEDDLLDPREMGVEISDTAEKALLKALEIRAKNRYQDMNLFQKDVFSFKDNENDNETLENFEVESGSKEYSYQQNNMQSNVSHQGSQAFAERQYEDKKLFADSERKKNAEKEQSSFQPKPNYAILVTLLFLFIAGAIIFLSLSLEEDFNGVTDFQDQEEKLDYIFSSDDSVLDDLEIDEFDVDYILHNEEGEIPLGELEIGDRIVDISWDWRHKLGSNYGDKDWEGNPTPPGKVKPVVWIVAAKDHYDDLAPHVTLISEELIGLHAFDNSENRRHNNGSDHWGNSGTGDASKGLRPWLNSEGKHAGNGFYSAFSNKFQEAVLSTPVPNKKGTDGSNYITNDKVFIPSSTELGNQRHVNTYHIGEAFSYFKGATDADRRAGMPGLNEVPLYYESSDYYWGYWTRSPTVNRAFFVCYVGAGGDIYLDYPMVNQGIGGVRPVVNVKSDVNVIYSKLY